LKDEFTLLRGSLMAGNNNPDLLRKFKIVLLKMKNNELVLLQEYNEVLNILLEMVIQTSFFFIFYFLNVYKKLFCYTFLNVYIMENYYQKQDVKKYCQKKTDNPNYNLHPFQTPFKSLVVAPSGSFVLQRQRDL
jgi:hypothetical protein